MQVNEYQKAAMATLNPALDKKDVLINSVMGLCGESGEAIDIVKKWLMQGHELDKEHLVRELGDVAWYLAEAATALDIPLEAVFQGQWGIPYETKKGWKWCYFANYADCKTVKNPTDIVTSATQQHRLSVNTIEKQLKACECELCGTTDSPCFEIHHVNKLKNLKGKLPLEVAMIAKRRKTLVVCHNCHVMIHHQ